MAVLLMLLSGVLFWFGIEAILLSRHASPRTGIEKDEMMFGKAHRRPIPEYVRPYFERRYPFAGSLNTVVYGFLFLAAGTVAAGLAWMSWT
jgi:hypothetical protein